MATSRGATPCVYVFLNGEPCPNTARNQNKHKRRNTPGAGMCMTHKSRLRHGSDMDAPIISRDRYFMKDDGIIDHIAVEIVSSGMRQVPLTRTEAELAIRKIIRMGGDRQVAHRRLGLSKNSVHLLYTQVRRNLVAEGVKVEGRLSVEDL